MTTVLFSNIDVAGAIVQHLHGEWDGFNAVLFKDEIDWAALRQALALVKLELNLEEKIEYCRVGDFCSLLTLTTRGGNRMGYSNIEQLLCVYSGYSREAIDALISSCGTKVIFNPQGIVSAEEMVNRLKAEGEI